MITEELDNFSLREICRSGQCFRMHETAENNTYELVAGDCTCSHQSPILLLPFYHLPDVHY